MAQELSAPPVRSSHTIPDPSVAQPISFKPLLQAREELSKPPVRSAQLSKAPGFIIKLKNCQGNSYQPSQELVRSKLGPNATEILEQRLPQPFTYETEQALRFLDNPPDPQFENIRTEFINTFNQGWTYERFQRIDPKVLQRIKWYLRFYRISTGEARTPNILTIWKVIKQRRKGI